MNKMKKKFFIAVFLGLAMMGANAQNGILHQEWYYSDGTGHDFFNNTCTSAPVALNITIYKDHVVASGTYCEWAGTKEWEQKTGRNMAFGYAYQSKRNSSGYLYEEFLQVDEKTFEVTLFCREQTAYGFPNTCSVPLKKASDGGSPQRMNGDQQYDKQQRYDQPQPTPQPQPQQKKICKRCNGTRRISKEDGFSLGMEKEYCSECRQTVVSGHYHIDCPYCHGTGYE